MRKGVRVRTLVAAGGAGSALVVAGAAYFAVGGAVERQLAGIVTPGQAAAAAAAARGAVFAAALAAFLVAALPLALAIGGLLTRALIGLRRSIGRLGDGRTTTMPAVPVAELHLIAAALDRLREEHRQRIEPLARERSELALLVDSVGEGIIQTAPDGRVVRANHTARVMLSLPGEVRGQAVAALIRNPELRRMLESAAHGQPVAPFEVTIDERRILVAAQPLGPADPAAGGRVGSASLFVDLTELRRLEGVRRDFVANASHELKTPLTSIRGYTETLLSDDLPDETRRRFLETVRDNAERLQHIVDDLLDLSRLESGGWRPDLRPIDAATIAEEVRRGFHDRAAHRRIDLRIAVTGSSRVFADALGLRQILANLLDNALRYTGDNGRITVYITGPTAAAPVPALGPPGTLRPIPAPASATSATPAEPRSDGSIRPWPAVAPVRPASSAVAGENTRDGWVAIEVHDTGIGIPRDALPRIFERFYRVDPARSRAEGGTGLGLAIVKHLVESMGGDITAESVLGKGTCVRVRLQGQGATGGAP